MVAEKQKKQGGAPAMPGGGMGGMGGMDYPQLEFSCLARRERPKRPFASQELPGR
jgi:hypothetical protein